MNNHHIEEDYTEKEVSDIFFEACKRGKLDFVDFFIHNKALKYNVDLKKDGYKGLDLALDNGQEKIVDYLLKYKEVTSDREFNFDEIFRLACAEDQPKILEVLIKHADETNIASNYNFKEAFSCSCRGACIKNIKTFLSNQHIVGALSNNYLLEKFDEATRTANEKLVHFFLTDDSLDFRINSKYYFFKISGFNPYYQRVKINKDIEPLVASYDLDHELAVQSLPIKKIMKI